jgi:hypothetical protein
MFTSVQVPHESEMDYKLWMPYMKAEIENGGILNNVSKGMFKFYSFMDRTLYRARVLKCNRNLPSQHGF